MTVATLPPPICAVRAEMKSDLFSAQLAQPWSSDFRPDAPPSCTALGRRGATGVGPIFCTARAEMKSDLFIAQLVQARLAEIRTRRGEA